MPTEAKSLEQERTFGRFRGMDDDVTVLGDFGRVLNEHSEHIERVEALLEDLLISANRLAALIELNQQGVLALSGRMLAVERGQRNAD